MKKQNLHRIIFCTFWIYFNAFRGILGHIRVLDYLGISLVPIGMILLASSGKVTSKMIQWATILMCPLVIATTVDPNTDIILFVLKSYVVALYLTIYLKTMKLTIVELACFVFPFVISVYYFFYPRYSDYIHLLQGRMSGIDEPNFTSLSLIISMCGAFGIHVLIKVKWIKVLVIAIACVCFLGVILTASRVGFIAATIALCLFLIIRKRKWYAGVAATIAIVIIFLYSGVAQHVAFVFERFQKIVGRQDMLAAIIYERPFMERAWNAVQHGEWFIGGGPQRISEWGVYNLAVPHNSLLDIGIEFGKASFYFYSALLIVLLFVNLMVIVIKWNDSNREEQSIMLTPMFFLSLFPMYMFLSAGMTMSFIFWMVLGAYPMLHLSPKFMKDVWKKFTYRHIKI